jgi:mono/diheme cytochrome c family protein
MKRYNAIGLVALLVLIAAFPLYAYLEPGRMDDAQAVLRQEFVAEGATIYVENCAACHGAEGEGLGAMPALNNPALASADHDLLYATIAHSPHGTIMSAWHTDEGGRLNSLQVESLVALIMNGGWSGARDLAVARGFSSPTPVAPEVELAMMESGEGDPHECQACHEEPAVHAERFGLNCSRCHTLQAWKPALLTRHTFFLDHGDEGRVACQTCHTENYAQNTCYGCHDHEPEQMETAHLQEEITEMDSCTECHPTGQEGEAARLGYGLSGQAHAAPSLEADAPASEAAVKPVSGEPDSSPSRDAAGDLDGSDQGNPSREGKGDQGGDASGVQTSSDGETQQGNGRERGGGK